MTRQRAIHHILEAPKHRQSFQGLADMRHSEGILGTQTARNNYLLFS
jgi:hypothetical protein